MFVDLSKLSPEQRMRHEQAIILEASAHHQLLRQAEASAFEENAKYQLELEKQSSQFRIEREAELRRENEAKRQAAAAGFEQNLREQFFAKNPHASESDYLSVKDDLKRQALLSNMNFGDKAEEISKNQVNYGAM